MQVIIAEKPSVARSIAAIVGASNRKDGFMEGNGYAVTWALGHLVALAMPEEYGIEGFKAENLPILPSPFILRPRQIKEGKEYKPDAAAAKQLGVIGKLFADAERIIVATDAGREGELIFRYIYSYLDCRTPFVRLWISSLTDSAITEGLKNLQPGSLYDNLYLSAKARSEADWLVGINASQSLAIAASRGTWSLGRVQTPTLAIICRRYRDYKAFIPKSYFQLKLHTAKDATMFSALSAAKYKSREDADRAYAAVMDAEKVSIIDVKRKTENEQPPLLYDLTTLQKEANAQHGFSADKTLGIAQSLYEGKLITYPRTGSRYISDDVARLVPSLIANLASYPRFAQYAAAMDAANLNPRAVNSGKVTDHHALLPTENTPSELAPDERTIYEMIVARMLESFSPACIRETAAVTLRCADEDYTAHGNIIVFAGWRAILGTKDEELSEDATTLPDILAGDELSVKGCDVLQKQTKPRPMHTEGSLLAAMESAGRELEDEAQREAMREGGIGTPATRAAIIETLLMRDYIRREKKTLVPTEKGLAVYDITKDKKIADVALTGGWELALSKIASGEMDAATFHKGIEVFTAQIAREMLEANIRMPDVQTGVTCPRCGAQVALYPKVAKCLNVQCALTVFRRIAKKELSDAQLNALFGKGSTGTIKGFTKTDGGTFDAAVAFDKDFKTEFTFPERKGRNNIKK